MEYYSKKLIVLENEIDKLKDENEVLWFLLEQLEEKYSKEEDYKKTFNDIYKESRYISLMKAKNETQA